LSLSVGSILAPARATFLESSWERNPSLAPRVERARVSAHLVRAEALLERAETTLLSPLRRLVRVLLLAELRRYRRRQRFPLNLDFAEPTPYFVDAAGTPCAVAHLLELSGEHALVQRIARERNQARVRELADEPRLAAWLTAAGLRLEEAAAIQPTYCSSPADCVCEADLVAVLDTTVTGHLEHSVMVKVVAIHGTTSHYQAGAEAQVTAPAQLPVGSRLLVPISTWTEANLAGSDTAAPQALVVSEGVYRCSGDNGSGFPLAPEHYFNAVLSSDCREYLHSLSESWTKRSCAEGGACQNSITAGDAPPTTVGILLALLALLVRRRTRR
jgi:MYXO-CTERM domain-containing protein